MTDAEREALAARLRHPRYEVMPLKGVEDQVAEHVPLEMRLTVSAPASRGLEPTLAVTERLTRRGYRVVPHLAARLVRDGEHLAEVVRRLAELGVDEVFVIGGDPPVPAGRFADALSLLEGMARLGHPFREVGIAGYPGGHPIIDDDRTIQAMLDKSRLATYLVSNLCLDPAVIAGWVRRVRRCGVTRPIHVGLPGMTDWRTLARISARIGLGGSARFLRRHSRWLPGVVLPGAYRPDRLLWPLAASLADQEANVPGLHFFTFNEVAGTERWRRRTLAQLER
jgi:methylenetetrahydrofolate reductase (NADPH)